MAGRLVSGLTLIRGAGAAPWLVFYVYFGCALATFAIASCLPIFTDEVGWKILNARYFFDSGHTVPAEASCFRRQFDIPLILRPFRILDFAIYGNINSPLWLRGIGVFDGLAWCAFTYFLIKCNLEDKICSRAIACLVIFCATLGVMPFLLVVNRPEQTLLFFITLFTIPVLLGKKSGSRRFFIDLAVAAAIVLISGYVFCAHPRGIFILPFALLFINHVLARKRMAVIAGCACVGLALVAAADWTVRMQCDAPALTQFMIAENNLTAIMNGHALEAWRKTSDMFIYDLGRFLYISMIWVRRPVFNDILPAVDTTLGNACGRLVVIVFGALMAAGGMAFIALAADRIRRRRLVEADLSLALLWLFYIEALATRSYRHLYEEPLLEPVMIMAAFGSLWAARDLLTSRLGTVRFTSWSRLGFMLLLGTSAISQVGLILGYAPRVATWLKPGYVQDQNYSIGFAGYGPLRLRIAALASRCGIDPATHPRHLIVDELTYFPIKASFEPFLAMYLNWLPNMGIDDYRKLLAGLPSDGVIAGCQRLPPPLRGAAISDGLFCCLPPPGHAGGP